MAQAKRHANTVAGHLDSAQRTLPAARKAQQEAQEEVSGRRSWSSRGAHSGRAQCGAVSCGRGMPLPHASGRTRHDLGPTTLVPALNPVPRDVPLVL